MFGYFKIAQLYTLLLDFVGVFNCLVVVYKFCFCLLNLLFVDGLVFWLFCFLLFDFYCVLICCCGYVLTFMFVLLLECFVFIGCSCLCLLTMVTAGLGCYY